MKYIKAIVSIIVLTAIDQITKFLAVRYLMEGGPIVLIDGVFELRYLENRGSAFGLMQNQRIFFIIIDYHYRWHICVALLQTSRYPPHAVDAFDLYRYYLWSAWKLY